MDSCHAVAGLLPFALAASGAFAISGAAPPPSARGALPADPAEPSITCVIRGGRLFESETGRVRPLGQLRIAGDRIVGEAPFDAPIPPEARRFEADGCTVLPGLFDLHTHVMVAGGGMSGPAAIDPELNLATHAAFGVTTAVDLHNEPDYVFGLRDRSNEAPSWARLLAAGAAFTVPGGHCTQFPFEANVIRAPGDVAARFDALLARKPDVVKAAVEHGGWGSLPTLPTLDEATLAQIGARARAAGIPLFCHVWTLEEAKQAVRAGANALVHGVYVGEVDDELVALMKERGTGYVPTLSVVVGAQRVTQGRSAYGTARLDGLLAPGVARALGDPSSGTWLGGWADYDEAQFLRNLKKLHAAGVRCGTGTDAGNPLTPHGPGLLAEIELYVEAGLAPAQALQCATIESARLLWRDRDFGSLAAGKVADVLVVRGDPVQDVSALWQVEGVLKAGVPVDRVALRQRQAGPAQAPRVRRLGRDLFGPVDEWDDGDLDSEWGGTWQGVSDASIPGGKSSAALELVEADGSGALLVRATIADGSPYGAFAGAWLGWNPIVPEHVDLADAREVVLRVRGTPRRWTLALERAAVVDYDVFAAEFEVADEWKDIRLPLASFRQAGFGQKVAHGFGDVTALLLSARTLPGSRTGFGAFELEVDWLRIE
jgi:imidazolonepropionase-like amidohydrolase